MPGHDAVNLHRNSSAEGNKFEIIQSSAVGANHRKINVRVSGGIAVARKMFGGRQAAVFLHAANELTHKVGDALRVFAEGPRVDDRISGIVVYIRVRRVDPVNSHGARLERRNFAHGVSVFEITACSDRHCRWKRRAFIQTHCCAALEIRANQQRQF